jgi:hypothetical protein
MRKGRRNGETREVGCVEMETKKESFGFSSSLDAEFGSVSVPEIYNLNL